MTEDVKTLPTAKMLRGVIPSLRSVAEVSKLVVRDRYRGCGVAQLALQASILEARRHAIEVLIISVIDELRFAAFLKRLGFELISRNLSFKDDKIEATRPAAAFSLLVPKLSIGKMEARFDTLLDKVRAAIEDRRSGEPEACRP